MDKGGNSPLRMGNFALSLLAAFSLPTSRPVGALGHQPPRAPMQGKVNSLVPPGFSSAVPRLSGQAAGAARSADPPVREPSGEYCQQPQKRFPGTKRRGIAK